MKEQMIEIALIGCGAAGQNHLDELVEVPGIRVVAVCDVRGHLASEVGKRYGVPAFTDTGVMLASVRPMAVSIVTNVASHAEIAFQALESGAHVICEKPLTDQWQKSRDLANKARAAGRILAVTYTYRFVPDFRQIRDWIDNGSIGKVCEVRFLNYSGPLKRTYATLEEKMRYDRIYNDSYGLLYDCGIHAFDLLRWFAGSEIVRIDGRGVRWGGYAFPDFCTVIFEYSNGVRGVYDTAPLPFYDNGSPCGNLLQVLVCGERGSIEWAFGKPDKSGTVGSQLTLYTSDGQEEKWFPIYGKERDQQYRRFADSIRAQRLLAPFPTPEECAENDRTAADVVRCCLEREICVTPSSV